MAHRTILKLTSTLIQTEPEPCALCWGTSLLPPPPKTKKPQIEIIPPHLQFKYPVLLWKVGSQNPSKKCVLHSSLPTYIYIIIYFIIPTTSFNNNNNNNNKQTNKQTNNSSNNNNNKHPVTCHPADHISLASSADVSYEFLCDAGPPLTLYLSLQCLVFLLQLHNTDSVFSKVSRGG